MEEEKVPHQDIANKKFIEGIISLFPSLIFAFILSLLGFTREVVALLSGILGVSLFCLVSTFPKVFNNRVIYLLVVSTLPGFVFALGKVGHRIYEARSNDHKEIQKNDASNYDAEKRSGSVPTTLAEHFASDKQTQPTNPKVSVDCIVEEYGFSSPRSSEPLILKVEPFHDGAHLEDIEASLTKTNDPANGMFLVHDECIAVSGQSITITPSKDWGVYSLFLTGKCKTNESTYKIVRSISTHVSYDKERLQDLTQSKAGPQVGKVAYANEHLYLDGISASSEVSFLHGLMMLRPYSIYVEAMVQPMSGNADGVIDLVQPNGVVISLRDKVNLGGKRGRFEADRKTFLLPLNELRQHTIKLRIGFDGSEYCVEDLTTGVRTNLGPVVFKGWTDVAAIAVRGCVCKISAIAIGTFTMLDKPKHQYSLEDKC